MSVSKINNNYNNFNDKTKLSSRYSFNAPELISNKLSRNRDKHQTSTIQQVYQKTKFNLFLSRESKLINYIKEDIESNLTNVKNPNSLYNYLYTFPGFRQYTKIYNFKPQTLIDSFRLGKYVKLEKNFKLFNQGEKTDFFYLVLSGHIGFILNSHSLKSGGPKEFYHDNIINSENNSKKFILKHINAFKKLGLSAFNHYYREIKKIYLEKRTQIFQMGEKANYFYLIYSGCCSIKNGYNNLIIKDIGDFFGLESLFDDNYETTIYTHSEEVVLFKFSVSTFNNDVLDELKNEFWIYYENQKILLKSWEENYKKYRNKYRMHFFNLIQNIQNNKQKNNKILSEMSLDEMASNNKNRGRNQRNVSPKKIKINFSSTTLNNNYNNVESIKAMSPKSSKSKKKIVKWLKIGIKKY